MPSNYWLHPRDPEKYDPEPTVGDLALAVDRFYSEPFDLFERINDRMEKGTAGDFYELIGRYFYHYYKGEMKEAENNLYWINRQIEEEIEKLSWEVMEEEWIKAAEEAAESAHYAYNDHY